MTWMMASTAPPLTIPVASTNNIVINTSQRGNPVLECIRNVGKEFGDIVSDYQVGRTTGVLFLSLKYHRLHPEYIHTRIEKLGVSYNLRILLILCDISEHREPIRELTKACLINNITVVVTFSSEEAGHYLTTYKQFEFKPPDLIKERTEKDYHSILRTALTSISKVNKTDVETLRTAFGSFGNMAKATPDQLQNLPGFGQVKVKNFRAAVENPFRNRATTSLSALASQSRSQTRLAHIHEPTSSSSIPQVRTREDSPAWDIETGPSGPDVEVNGSNNHPGHDASNSGVFDIELDL